MTPEALRGSRLHLFASHDVVHTHLGSLMPLGLLVSIVGGLLMALAELVP